MERSGSEPAHHALVQTYVSSLRPLERPGDGFVNQCDSQIHAAHHIQMEPLALRSANGLSGRPAGRFLNDAPADFVER